MNSSSQYDDIILPVYVINLDFRTDRLQHIQDQFKDKPEFELNIVKASKSKNGALGLWRSIVKVVRMAQEKDEDMIIICEDDHQFTENYTKDFLIDSILEANEYGANILIGGIGGFKNAIPVTDAICWVDSFWSTQFVVVYKQFFDKILTEPFRHKNDTADGKFSEMTSNKMSIFPFISIQKDFGYSDVSDTPKNEKGLSVDELFVDSGAKLKRIYAVRDHYMKFSN